MQNKCDLIFIIDMDEPISLPAFIFQKNSNYEELINIALADMSEYMVAVGAKYDLYQSTGDQCQRDNNNPAVALQSRALQVTKYYFL